MPTQNLRVLIIDELPEVHEQLRNLFHDNPRYEFDSAFAADEALTHLQKSYEQGEPYALAIVDINEPSDWNGLETIERIRAVDPDIELIICSAYASESWMEIAEQLGICDKYLFLNKPFRVSEVKQMVMNLGAKWRLQARNKVYMQELAAARSMAETSDRAKRDFLGIIGHELRTPLNVILMTLEDLLESHNDQTALDVIRNSHRSTMRLGQIIEGVLLYTHLDSSQFSLSLAPFKLNDLVAYCEQQFHPLCKEKKLQLHIHVAPEVPENLIGDVKLLRHMLTQILFNSVRFTDRGYIEIRISAVERGSSKIALAPAHIALQFKISDSGRGMNDIQLERCCQLFYQGDSFRHHSRTGIGLGLNLCKKIIDSMRGVFQVDSEEAQGTVVDVTIPVLKGYDSDKIKKAPEPLARHLASEI